MLPDAEVNVAPGRALGAEIAGGVERQTCFA